MSEVETLIQQLEKQGLERTLYETAATVKIMERDYKDFALRLTKVELEKVEKKALEKHEEMTNKTLDEIRLSIKQEVTTAVRPTKDQAKNNADKIAVIEGRLTKAVGIFTGVIAVLQTLFLIFGDAIKAFFN